MAGPRTWQSSRWNLLPADEDKFAGATQKAPINDNSTPSHTPVVSRVPTPALALPLALAELVAKYTNADLQRATKLALKLFVQGQ